MHHALYKIYHKYIICIIYSYIHSNIIMLYYINIILGVEPYCTACFIKSIFF